VISLETNHRSALSALDEQIENLARMRSAVDVIAQKNLNRSGDGKITQICIDPREECAQEIHSPMHVADGINPELIRNARNNCFRQLDQRQNGSRGILPYATSTTNSMGTTNSPGEHAY
jgi:hypothetical protein